MRPLVFAILSLIFISINSVILERKLSGISPLASMAIYHTVYFVFVIPIWYLCFQPSFKVTWPEGNAWLFIFIFSFISLLAGFCTFSAYNTGGSLLTVTVVLTFVPILASVLKGFLTGEWLNLTQILGCFLAVVAVVLVVHKS